MRLWCILVVVACVGFGSGCETGPKVVPKGRVVVDASTEQKRLEVAAKLLNEVVIKLPPITRPGTAWTLVLNDGRFLEQRGAIQVESDGSATATFLAIRQGRRLIRFFALPPNDREASPAQAHEVRVTIE